MKPYLTSITALMLAVMSLITTACGNEETNTPANSAQGANGVQSQPAPTARQADRAAPEHITREQLRARHRGVQLHSDQLRYDNGLIYIRQPDGLGALATGVVYNTMDTSNALSKAFQFLTQTMLIQIQSLPRLPASFSIMNCDLEIREGKPTLRVCEDKGIRSIAELGANGNVSGGFKLFTAANGNSGQLVLYAQYSNGLLHGSYRYNSSDDSVSLVQATFNNGKPVGEARGFYQDGSAYGTVRFDHQGLKQGVTEFFWPDGSPHIVAAFDYNRLIGEIFEYYRNGIVHNYAYYDDNGTKIASYSAGLSSNVIDFTEEQKARIVQGVHEAQNEAQRILVQRAEEQAALEAKYPPEFVQRHLVALISRENNHYCNSDTYWAVRGDGRTIWGSYCRGELSYLDALNRINDISMTNHGKPPIDLAPETNSYDYIPPRHTPDTNYPECLRLSQGISGSSHLGIDDIWRKYCQGYITLHEAQIQIVLKIEANYRENAMWRYQQIFDEKFGPSAATGAAFLGANESRNTLADSPYMISDEEKERSLEEIIQQVMAEPEANFESLMRQRVEQYYEQVKNETRANVPVHEVHRYGLEPDREAVRAYYESRPGYVPMPPPPPIVNESVSNYPTVIIDSADGYADIYSEPSKSSSREFILNNGRKIEICGIEGDWYCVSGGYIHKSQATMK